MLLINITVLKLLKSLKYVIVLDIKKSFNIEKALLTAVSSQKHLPICFWWHMIKSLKCGSNGSCTVWNSCSINLEGIWGNGILYDIIRYDMIWYDIWYMIYLTAIGLPPGGSSTVHIYTQTVHRTTQSTQTIHRTTQLGRVWTTPHLCKLYPGICQLRKKHGKSSVRVVRECQLAWWKQNIQNRAYKQ